MPKAMPLRPLGPSVRKAESEMSFSFALCPECLAQYRALMHDPTCHYGLNSIPFCSLTWPDEHPRDGGPAPTHEGCLESIMRLAGARTWLWKTGAIPDELKELWAEAQRMIPNWPGFLRLSLNQEQRLSLEDCKRAATKIA